MAVIFDKAKVIMIHVTDCHKIVPSLPPGEISEDVVLNSRSFL